MQELVARVIHQAQVQRSGVQIDPAVELALLFVGSHHGLRCLSEVASPLHKRRSKEPQQLGRNQLNDDAMMSIKTLNRSGGSGPNLNSCITPAVR